MSPPPSPHSTTTTTATITRSFRSTILFSILVSCHTFTPFFGRRTTTTTPHPFTKPLNSVDDDDDDGYYSYIEGTPFRDRQMEIEAMGGDPEFLTKEEEEETSSVESEGEASGVLDVVGGGNEDDQLLRMDVIDRNDPFVSGMDAIGGGRADPSSSSKSSSEENAEEGEHWNVMNDIPSDTFMSGLSSLPQFSTVLGLGGGDNGDDSESSKRQSKFAERIDIPGRSLEDRQMEIEDMGGDPFFLHDDDAEDGTKSTAAAAVGKSEIDRLTSDSGVMNVVGDGSPQEYLLMDGEVSESKQEEEEWDGWPVDDAYFD